MRKQKKVANTRTEQTYLIMQKHINGYGRLFGGQLLMWMDELAGIVSKRHAECEITTACIDRLNFKTAAYLNDTVVLVGRVTYTGRSSMEIRVDAYAESLQGIRRMINTAYFVMVAIDQNGHSVEVPELICETAEQKMEWECAERRYRLRKQRKKEGF